MIGLAEFNRRAQRPDGVAKNLPSISFGAGYGTSGYIDFSNHPGFGSDAGGVPWSIAALAFHVYTADSIMFSRLGSTSGNTLRWGTNGNRHLSIENGYAIGNTKCVPSENRWGMCGSGSIGSSGVWMATGPTFNNYDDGNWTPYPWSYDWRTGSSVGTPVMKVGSWAPGSYQMNGALAGMWLWKGSLDPDDWGRLNSGYNPENIKPQALAFSWFAPADVSSNLYTYDRVTGIVGTKAGGSSMSRGPSVNFPLKYRRERGLFYFNRGPKPFGVRR